MCILIVRLFVVPVAKVVIQVADWTLIGFTIQTNPCRLTFIPMDETPRNNFNDPTIFQSRFRARLYHFTSNVWHSRKTFKITAQSALWRKDAFC
jgi:hypothetical protein